MANWVAAEHSMWHAFNGPSGPAGVACPWDACGYAAGEAAEAEAEYQEWLATKAPALREGETYVHYYGWPVGPECKWWTGDDNFPPF